MGGTYLVCLNLLILYRQEEDQILSALFMAHDETPVVLWAPIMSLAVFLNSIQLFSYQNGNDIGIS